jgi:tetratricopeptide (TPR) repeat protein
MMGIRCPGKVFAVVRAAAIVLCAGTSWAQDIDPRSLLPATYAKLSAQDINRQGLVVHPTSTDQSAELFSYVTLLAPAEAYGHFNLACALSRLGWKDAAVQELRRALEANRAWTEPNLKDPDLDNVRFESSFADLLAWLAGGTSAAPAGTPAPVPEQYRSQTPQALTKLALAAHNAGDYTTSSRLFGYAAQLDPKAAPSRFNLACALSRLGKKAEAIMELGRALELDPAIVKYFDDPDLDGVRHEPGYSALLERLTERSGTALGSWQGQGLDARPGGVPAWLPKSEIAWPSALLSMLPGGALRIEMAGSWVITGTG